MKRNFWSYVDKKGDDECWQWLGSIYPDTRCGSYLTGSKKRILAHRQSWELTYGRKPGNIARTCSNPGCVNPKHYYEGGSEIRRRKYGKQTVSSLEEFMSNVAFPDTGCWEWVGKKANDRYGTYHGEGAHRWAYRHLIGELCEGDHVLHSCDNKSCVSPDHIRIGTRRDNTLDIVASDNHYSKLQPEKVLRGEGHGMAILNEEKVKEIRAKYANGMTQINLGKEYGVHNSTISLIVSRDKVTGKYKKWAHVE